MRLCFSDNDRVFLNWVARESKFSITDPVIVVHLVKEMKKKFRPDLVNEKEDVTIFDYANEQNIEVLNRKEFLKKKEALFQKLGIV